MRLRFSSATPKKMPEFEPFEVQSCLMLRLRTGVQSVQQDHANMYPLQAQLEHIAGAQGRV
jgi:hypothetical protein